MIAILNIEPCPYCGRSMKVDYEPFPISKYGIKHISKFYFDDMCYGGTAYVYDSEEEAIKAWNEEVFNDSNT